MRAPRPAADLFSAERAAVCAEDFQFWPHSNFAPLTIGVYLEDVHPDSGPMKIVPLSREYRDLPAHRGQLFNM